MKDGMNETSYFDLYPKERLKQLQSTCCENIKRMTQRFGVVALETDFLRIEEANDKYLLRQLNDAVFLEDTKKVYEPVIKNVKAKEKNMLEKIEETNKFFLNYNKKLLDETHELQKTYKEVSEQLNKKIKESLEEVNKLIKLFEEIALVIKGAERIKNDMAYFKIPDKFPKCEKKCQSELERRQVFNKLAIEYAEQLETLFDTEIKLRDEFQKKYGKYIPKEVFPQLNYAIPSIKLTTMLKKCKINIDTEEDKEDTIINKYFKECVVKKESNKVQGVTIKEELEKELKEIKKKLEDSEQKLTAEIARNEEILSRVNDYDEKLNKSEMMILTHTQKEKEQLDKISAYDSNIKQLKKTIEELDGQLKMRSFDLNSVSTSLKNKSNLIKQLKSIIKTTTSEFRSTSGALISTFKANNAEIKKWITTSLNSLLRLKQSHGAKQVSHKVKESSLSSARIIRYFADFKLNFDKSMESSAPEKVLEYALNTLKAKELKLLQAFKLTREKLISKTKEESNLRLSSIMSSQINSSGVSQIFSRDIVVGGSKLISYENFMEGSTALFFRMPNKMYQALNFHYPYYFIESSQHFDENDYLVAGKIKIIRQDKKIAEVLGLPKDQLVYSCAIDIIFKTNLKEPFSHLQ